MSIIDGIPFECKKCGKCCRWKGYIFLTPKDIKRISRNLRINSRDFLDIYTKKIGIDLVLKDKENSSDCIFLKGNLCRIENFKPEQCQKFPFHYDPRCPGFKREDDDMESRFEKAVKQVNERFSSMQNYEKAIVNNLYRDLNSGSKKASVISRAVEAGSDRINNLNRIKISSLADIFSFDRVDKDHLIHKSERDLWKIEQDKEGNVQIARLFNNGEPIKG